MGLLDSLLGGSRSRSGGGMSPLTLALLALLAYRTYQGKGRLAEMLGGRDGRSGSDGGGLGGLLSGLAGGTGSSGLGQLAGMLGGASAGGLLSGGLSDLMRQFQQSGRGDIADSWVGRGPNREIAPEELEQALGRDTLQTLSDETGRPYADVLSELSRSLPDSIDQLTPEGHLPSEEEASRWV